MSQAKTDLRIGRLGLNVLAALAVGLGGGWWPTARLAGRLGIESMVAAAVAGVLGLSAGLAILLRRAQVDRAKLAMMFLATAPVRMLVTLGLAVGAWWIGPWPAGPLLLWVAVFYLLLLAAETSWLYGLLRGLDRTR